MQIQKSFEDETRGALHVVPTPIGNLEDITYRALKALQGASIIAAEDTRNTKKLLNHFDIHVPLISYHAHNQAGREAELIERLEQGEQVAIVSDAGMPAISDPGEEIVKAAISRDIPVVVLPGANAALCALVGSGLGAKEFLFYGFLPRKKKERNEELERLGRHQATLLFYESPHRLKETLEAIREVLGGRKMAIARELTKRFEEYVRGTAEELLEWSRAEELRGEFCLVVEGRQEELAEDTEEWWAGLSILAHIDHYMSKEGLTSKEAIKETATDRGMAKRDVYRQYHIEEQ